MVLEKYKLFMLCHIRSSIYYTWIIFTNYKFWIIFILLKFINPHSPQTYLHIFGIINHYSLQYTKFSQKLLVRILRRQNI